MDRNTMIIVFFNFQHLWNEVGDRQIIHTDQATFFEISWAVRDIEIWLTTKDCSHWMSRTKPDAVDNEWTQNHTPNILKRNTDGLGYVYFNLQTTCFVKRDTATTS